MLSADEQRKLTARLRRIEGQVAGVARMIDEEQYCVDVLLQIAAARAALGRVGRLVLESHVNSCVAAAMSDGDDDERAEKLRELLDVFEQYADLKRK